MLDRYKHKELHRHSRASEGPRAGERLSLPEEPRKSGAFEWCLEVCVGVRQVQATRMVVQSQGTAFAVSQRWECRAHSGDGERMRV